MGLRDRRFAWVGGAVLVVGATACSSSSPSRSSATTSGNPAGTAATGTTATGTAATGIAKHRHVVRVMQEHRSFDSYFGTFPGADGIPASHGQFTVCLPNPATKV